MVPLTVAPPIALDARLNARCFTDRQSVVAEALWHPNVEPGEASTLNLVLERLTPDEQRSLLASARSAGISLWLTEDRGWLSGSANELRAALVALTGHSTAGHSAVGNEASATVAHFLALVEQPRPTQVMGILNLTPDSFSDGGQWVDPDRAVAHALQMVEDGATVLDLGGESTRPGADEIPPDEELRRVLPVLQALRPRTQATLSIDTRKSAVARACLEEGADWINDVSGLTYDPVLAGVVAQYSEARLVLMHSRAAPSQERYSTQYAASEAPRYEDVVADTLRWLRERASYAVEQGVSPYAIWIDPGFGFGKSFEQNVTILRRLREYTSTGMAVLVGTSRKSSVGRLGGNLPPEERLEATAATVAHSIANGAAAIRVHDVKEMARVARVADALR
jgi:dihydropteroate synthase